MRNEIEKQKVESNFTYRIVRISPEIKRFVPIVGTGLRLLISSWEFPAAPYPDARATRVRLSQEDVATIDYIARHAGKSATAVIVAALRCAENSHVRPPAPSGRWVQRSSCEPRADG